MEDGYVSEEWLQERELEFEHFQRRLKQIIFHLKCIGLGILLLGIVWALYWLALCFV